MPHTCPRIGCEATVPDDKLACYADWYRVPQALRRAVTRAWRGGQGVGSPQYRAALRAAIKAMNRER